MNRIIQNYVSEWQTYIHSYNFSKIVGSVIEMPPLMAKSKCQKMTYR